MRLVTYNKRFDIPLSFLKYFFMPIMRAKNGKWYQVAIGSKGLPVARLVHHHLPDESEPVLQEKIFEKKAEVEEEGPKGLTKYGKKMIPFT